MLPATSKSEYLTFSYGHDRSRYAQTEFAGSLTTTRHYASPGLFEVTLDGVARTDYHYVHANGRAVALFTTSDNALDDNQIRYLHRSPRQPRRDECQQRTLLGRFLSPDPFVQAPYHSQSLNRYSYVWNNPLTLVDPSGFQLKCAVATSALRSDALLRLA